MDNFQTSYFWPIFRLGPFFIVPAMVVASFAYSPLAHYDSFPAYLILLGLPVTAAWHLALIIVERPKLLYVVFALFNCGLYVLWGFYCLFWVTGDTI